MYSNGRFGSIFYPIYSCIKDTGCIKDSGCIKDTGYIKETNRIKDQKHNIQKLITKITPEEKEVNSNILKIPYWEYYFYTFFSLENVHVGIMEDDFQKNNSELYLIKYKTYPTKSFTSNYDTDNVRKTLKNLFYAQEYLFQSAERLSNKNIIHLDICDENIIMKEDIPLLRITNKCILLKDIEKKYNMSTRYPIELYTILYLKKHAITCLSVSNIYEMLKEYTTNTLQDSSTNEDVQTAGFYFLKPFINQPIKTVIKELLKFSPFWNYYFVSLFFLEKIKHYNTEHKFILEWKDYLIHNTQIDPRKRVFRTPSSLLTLLD